MPYRRTTGILSKGAVGLSALAIAVGMVAMNGDEIKKKVAYDELRKHFREATSKLDRWIFQKDIKEYFKEKKNEGKRD